MLSQSPSAHPAFPDSGVTRTPPKFPKHRVFFTGSSAQPPLPLLRSRSLVSLGLRGRGVWNPLKTQAECRLPLGHTVPLGSTRWQASPGQVAAGFWVLPRKGLRAESLGVKVREEEGSLESTQNRKLFWSVRLERFFALGMWLGKVVGAAWPRSWLLGALPILLSQVSWSVAAVWRKGPESVAGPACGTAL